MPIQDRDYMGGKTETRRAIRWRGHSLGWPYALIVIGLGLNWLWDIFDRVIQ